ncbi:hypothetical protein P7D85_02920 [Enterococcus hulanensis]|uniref:DUF1146 domain-containing protein n=1 Tax=Enterococcus hulanensis TaxID=2559929 RepID=A0ABU3EV20_9ENTE|nr:MULTISPECIES: hypothetical protein [Enterococcus]MBX8935315.1 hypothetical protein [Enterococcus gilvus]MDT2598708.1 hypothetical protein [Enterococcus hulanensis]MDT2607788.1 hypothetical protein [Enterococcus hulanensis]MDT2615083.1 hypothetical protein [Enterococcus hulanensis]MDT2626947.1 hypothetical protein [Enterococcus hulanensis]
MTIPMWLGVFGAIAVIGLISFLLFFIKDSRLRMEYQKKSTVLLVDCGLLFIMLVAIAAAIFLYLDWQAQLNYFLAN